MTTYYIIAGLWFLAGVFIGEQETILKKYAKTWVSGKWWNENNWKKDNPFWHWMFKYPLSFLKDGEHFCKMISTVLLATSMAIVLFSIWWHIVLCVIALYIINGMGFHVSFHDGI